MAETETKVDAGTFESRLETLEKSVRSMETTQRLTQKKMGELLAAHLTGQEMLAEVVTLVRRAAPLLDSPMVKMAQSPAGSAVLGLLGKGRGRG